MDGGYGNRETDRWKDGSEVEDVSGAVYQRNFIRIAVYNNTDITYN